MRERTCLAEAQSAKAVREEPVSPKRRARRRTARGLLQEQGMTPPLAPVLDPQVSDTSRSRSESMCGLAGLLLDWRAECEQHLRALTSIQRWLERVRCGAAGEGERDLLIQEMGRLLQQPAPDHENWSRRAETYLNNLSR